MNWGHIHLIRGRIHSIAFHWPTSTIKIINDFAFQIITLLKKGYSLNSIVDIYSDCDKEMIISFIESFDASINQIINEKRKQSKIIFKSHSERTINRITVHVSNDCNLRCKYCYAQGGNYGLGRGNMSLETAKAFVNFCVKEFDRVCRIVFFGGEPMLNINAMETICNSFKQYRKERKISYIPSFILVTNGTILNDRLMSFINTNIDIVSVSIDGPVDVHDANRVFIDGKGSYNRTASFIRKLKESSNVQLQYEATYTRTHLEKQVSRESVMEFLDNEFGLNGAVVDEDSIGLQPLLDYWENLYENFVKERNFKYLPEDFFHVFSLIINNEENHVCQVVKKIFAVNADGEIFACHLLNGVERNCLGNIRGINIFNSTPSFQFVLEDMQFKNTEKCLSCWAQRLCGGCAVHGFYHKEKQEFKKEPNGDHCAFMKQYLEKIILFISSIRKNNDLWLRLVDYANSINGNSN